MLNPTFVTFKKILSHIALWSFAITLLTVVIVRFFAIASPSIFVVYLTAWILPITFFLSVSLIIIFQITNYLYKKINNHA